MRRRLSGKCARQWVFDSIPIPRTSCLGLILSISILFSTSSYAQTARIFHTPLPPLSSGDQAIVSFRLEGDDPAVSADVAARRTGDTEFERFAARERGGTWTVTLPGRLSAAPGIEYAILVNTESGLVVSSPENAPLEHPHLAIVTAENAAARIVILAPEPDGVVERQSDLLLSVLFDPPVFEQDISLLYLDGREITKGIERTEDYILHQPENEIAPGAHEVTVVLIDENGRSIEKKWSFFYREYRKKRELNLSGKVEVGWASVQTGNVSGTPYPPYDETSSLRFDLYGYGDWGGRAIYVAASRDPIYDDEIRATGRISGDHIGVEAGDIYPSFSELSVSWLSGEGGQLSLTGGPLRSQSFWVRTLSSDTTGGFGTYSQFIAGEKLSFRNERFEGNLQVAYGWENEESIPESLRFLVPIKNLVATAGAGVGLAWGMKIEIEGGVSDTEGDDTTKAGAFRTLLTIHDDPSRRLLIEYHTYDPSYYALGSPTVDGGERGFLVDGTIRFGNWVRQSAKVELYDDRDSFQKIKDGRSIVQLYGRTDLYWKRGQASLNPYFLFRTYEIPYDEAEGGAPYRSRYGSAGVYGRWGKHNLSLIGTRSITTSTTDTETWTAAAYLSGVAAGDRVRWKIGERYGATESTGEIFSDLTNDLVSAEGLLSDEERWTFIAETSLRIGRFDWRAEYERITEDDPVDEIRFIQHLFSLVAGRRF